jgi:WD40 repeat protein
MFEVEEAGAGDQALAVKPFAGAIVPPDNEPRVNEVEPNINLQLDYVYGYRCFDTRQNVFYTTNDRNIVYIAAAVGIVLDTNSNNQQFLGGGVETSHKGHGDDITAIAIAPDRKTVATGEVGKNPKIIVWDAGSMSIAKAWRNGRGSRAVTSLAFSKDGNLLVSTAFDNDYTVRVWNWRNAEQIHADKGGTEKILDCAWSLTADTFATVGFDYIWFWAKDA